MDNKFAMLRGYIQLCTTFVDKIVSHLKLCIATAIHSFKCLKFGWN